MGSESIPSIPLMNEIVQHCFLPRALMSPMDAEYCATFIRSIHKNGTPGFSTLACYDRLIGDQLAPFITSCSDREAINFSKFLRHILADFTRWLNPEVYKKEQATKSGEYFPGFVKKVTSLVKPTFKADDLLNSNEIGTWVQKLHKKILKAAIICLESNEYRPVKNIFLVLNEILPQFPKKIVSPALGITLQPAVKAYLNDDRDDIKVLATGYYNKLELDKAHWLPDIPAPPTNATVTPAPSPAPVAPPATAPVETPAPSASQPLGSSVSRSTAGPGPESTAPSASQQSITGLPAKPQSLGRTSSANNTHLQPGSSANPAGSRTNTNVAAGGPAASTSHRPTESIPRPEFIPRGKTGVPASNASPGSGPTGQDTRVSQAPNPSGPTPSARVSPSVSSLPAKPRDLPARPDSRTDITHSPRPNRRNDDVSARGAQPMPPPVAPSSKPTAQDLRSSARAVPTGKDEGDDRPSRAPRRNSPASSRPATRNASSDSRTSDPARTDRGSIARDRGDRTSKREREQESDREQDRTGIEKGKRSAIVIVIANEIATRTRIEKGSVIKVEEIVIATDAKENLEKNATVTVDPFHPRPEEVVGRKIESTTPLLVMSPLVLDLPSTTIPISVAVKKSRMKVLPNAFERTDEIVHALRRGKPLETPMVEKSARPNVLGLLTDVIDFAERKKGAQRRRTGGKETRATVNVTETRTATLEMETGAKKGEKTSEAGGMRVVKARENANGPMRQTARSGTERSVNRLIGHLNGEIRLIRARAGSSAAATGPPSEPRAMKVNKPSPSESSSARLGALQAASPKKGKHNLLRALPGLLLHIAKVLALVETSLDLVRAIAVTDLVYPQSVQDPKQVVIRQRDSDSIVVISMARIAKHNHNAHSRGSTLLAAGDFVLYLYFVMFITISHRPPLFIIQSNPMSSEGKQKNLTGTISQHVRDFTRQYWIERPNNKLPTIVGIQGPQGSGKTTTAKAVKNYLEDLEGWYIVSLSLDDFYLTHDGLRSVAAAHPNNPLLNGRGQPGTHDLELGRDILDRLQQINVNGQNPETEDEVPLPVFDKSLHDGEGDRLPEGSGEKIKSPVQLVIVEGWCLGFYPLSDAELERRYQAIKEKQDLSYSLQDLKDINGYLKLYVEKLYSFFSCFVQIMPGPDPIALTYKWRLQQEHDMKAKNGGRGMTDEQVKAFIDRYIPSYLYFADGLENGFNTDPGVEPVSEKYPPWRGHHLRVTIDENRDITKTEKL
ncbi:hypothetical protein FRB90_002149 [Tulasnella sp. 427]|nr:hypothetical protein FRB90_002149 [Tulasnella sp. 427]